MIFLSKNIYGHLLTVVLIVKKFIFKFILTIIFICHSWCLVHCSASVVATDGNEEKREL